jgi:hypothetical protein
MEYRRRNTALLDAGVKRDGTAREISSGGRDLTRRNRRIAVVLVRPAAAGVVAVAAVLAAPASADIGVTLITKSARPADTARLRGPTGMPLYLVTASRAPMPYRCGRKTICRPKSIGPPDRWPYVRLRRLLARTNAGVITFLVPNLRSGVYRAAVYCAACYRGPAGSVIVSGNTITIHRGTRSRSLAELPSHRAPLAAAGAGFEAATSGLYARGSTTSIGQEGGLPFESPFAPVRQSRAQTRDTPRAVRRGTMRSNAAPARH